MVPAARPFLSLCSPGTTARCLEIRLIPRRKQTAALSALVCCALAALSSPSEAGETDLHVALQYEVDASTRGCWDEAKFRRGVAHRIGYDPFRQDAPLSVRVHVGGSALAVDGQVEWRDASGSGLGERAFVAKDGNCAKLMTEMSFAVGLQIEFLRLKTPKPAPIKLDSSPPVATPDSEGSPIPTKDETPTSSSASAESEPTAPPAAAAPEPVPAEKPLPKVSPEESAPPPSHPSPPWSVWVGVGPSLAWRLSPGVTADGRLFVGLGRGRLSFEIGAEATYPSTFHRWDESGFRHMLIGASLAVCGHLDWFSACALGRASQVRISGLGVDERRSPTGFVGQLGARLAATWHLAGRWSLATHLDGLALLTPSTVDLNQTPVWEMPRLGALWGIDLLARFR